MLLRGVFLGLIGALATIVVLQGPTLSVPAAAAAQVGPLQFSTDIGTNFAPAGDVGVEFSGSNNGVYVTFPYQDLPGGSGLSRIVRFNGEDYNYDNDTFGKLTCCPGGGSGRYGFRVVKRSGSAGDLPGGSYDVRIYLNGTEIASGGFGIKGTGGSDHDNGNDNN